MKDVRDRRVCKDLQPHLVSCVNAVRLIGPRLIEFVGEILVNWAMRVYRESMGVLIRFVHKEGTS
jgi:hypothetical protein